MAYGKVKLGNIIEHILNPIDQMFTAHYAKNT